ncbi:MAG: Gldg family protein [Verrucomicrobiota bacterium]
MASESNPPARPVKRFRVGFLSILQVLLVIVIFISLNFLSSQIHRPFDISDDLGFTLSPSTTRYLASDTLSSREEPLKMIVAFRADNPFYEKIRPIAEEYMRLSKGKIQLQLVDPFRANDLAETLSAEYGIVFNQDVVIIDARTSEEREAQEVNQVSPKVNIVKLEDMVIYETDANNQRRARQFLGEDALRAGLVAAIEGKPRRMWVLADKSDLNHEGSEAWSVLSANMISQNILPERVPIAAVEEIPEDVSCLAIIGPTYDLTPEELQLVEDYWNRPRSSLLITTGEKDVPPRLRAFLRKNGVTPRNDRVLTVKSGAVQTTVTSRFTSGMDFTRDLWEKTTLFEGVTRSLEVRAGENALMENGIFPHLLLESTPAFWGESQFPADETDFDTREDVPGPVALAAAVIRGAPNDERLASEISRMVVIANSSFLEPNEARKPNMDFLASGANWLVGREQLSGEGPANIRLYKLPLLEPQVAFINRVNLLFLPGFALLIGAMVWSARRS